MRAWKINKYKVPGYIKEALEFLCPPEDLTVSEWAEKYRILDEKSSAMPGPWRNSMTPYLVGIMDEFSNYQTEEIVFCKPTQIGGTEIILNSFGYIVMQDPAPTMVVYPTDTLGESTAVNRIIPMFNASPRLSEKIDLKRSGKDEIQFENMFIAIAGSNSPSGLASKPIRFLFMDEIDKYPSASRKEADPISLATERTKTFRNNRKIYKTSTPTLKTGQIWKALQACDVERHYFVPCPHCDEMIELKMSQIKWPSKEDGLSHQDRAEQAHYVCQKCGCIINDADKLNMLQHGEWRDVRCDTAFVRKVGFWINTIYSPFVRFSDVALEFMESKDDPEKLQNFTNSWLAEPWEEIRNKTSADLVMERQTQLPRWTLPQWTRLVTGGIDVQETSVYWVIRAFGPYLTSQGIAHGQALSLHDAETIMNLELVREDGRTFVPQLVLIDSGDQTDEVYEFCTLNADWAMPCKGMGNRMSHYTISKINKAGSSAFGMPLVLVDGGKYKDMIAARMQKENGTGSWMVHAGCDLDYAEQVTSEHKVTERATNGKQITIWKPKRSHAANHYLDAEVYAFAAADIMGVRQLFLQDEEDAELAEEERPKREDEMPASSFVGGERWL